MEEYHKIQTVFFRDLESKHKYLLEGQWALPEFEYLAKNKWVFTEKVDGTNIRVIFKDGRFSFEGKTNNAQTPPFLLKVLSDIFLPQADLFNDKFPDGVCLYGEGYGAKIQKGGGNYRSDNGFALFDVKIGGIWLMRSSVEEIASSVGIEIVPIIGTGTLFDMVEKVRTGFNSLWGDFIAEGIVAKPEVEIQDRRSNRVITKLKYKDFKRE
jgi:ATP-dependent RNA circularization protein (DNA/RNA ligase family)